MMLKEAAAQANPRRNVNSFVMRPAVAQAFVHTVDGLRRNESRRAGRIGPAANGHAICQ